MCYSLTIDLLPHRRINCFIQVNANRIEVLIGRSELIIVRIRLISSSRVPFLIIFPLFFWRDTGKENLSLSVPEPSIDKQEARERERG